MFSSYFPEKSFFLTIMYKGTAKTANNPTKIIVTKENIRISKETFNTKKINFTNIYATKIAIIHDIIFFISNLLILYQKTSVNKRKTHKMSVISIQIGHCCRQPNRKVS